MSKRVQGQPRGFSDKGIDALVEWMTENLVKEAREARQRELWTVDEHGWPRPVRVEVTRAAKKGKSR